MQIKGNTFFLLAIAALLFSTCKDSEDEAARFSATLNGQAWQPDASTARAKFRNGQITLSSAPYCDLSFVFDGQTVGQYATGREQFNFVIAHDQTCGEEFYTNLEDLNTGTLEITEIDQSRKTISGKFSFKATANSGLILKVENGVFENIPYDEEAGNSANQADRGWFEENGKKYALNLADYQDRFFYSTTSSRKKIFTMYFPADLLSTGDYEVTSPDTADNKFHLVYYQVNSPISSSEYEAAPGSQLHLTVLPGTLNYLATLDLVVLKKYNTHPGPDSLHLKSAFEIYQ